VREHDGQVTRGLRAHDVLQPWQFDFQHLLVEEQQGRQCRYCCSVR
jgi:hypothetical protein